MRESEFASRYRMATYEDSPWERIWTRPTRPQTSSMLTKPTLGLKLVNSAGDMLDSMTRFMVDALRSQTLLRYLFLSSYKQRQQQQQSYNYNYYRTMDHDDDDDNDGNNVESNDSVTTTTTTELVIARIIQLLMKLVIGQKH